MTKTKRIFIFVFLGLMIAAYVFVPMFDNVGKDNRNDIEEYLAKFSFTDNIVLTSGESKNIMIDHFSGKASKISLYLDDSLLKTWNSPAVKLNYDFVTNKLNVGAKELRIAVYKGANLVFEDSRLVVVLSDLKPEILNASVKSLTPHNTAHFTQGFEFLNGELYEGTGQYGESVIAKIDLKSGNSLISKEIDPNCFGEGITILNGKLYQITWQQQKCFVYDVKSLVKIQEITYSGEGWGLCNDGKNLIMSDGTERLYFRNPQTFELIKTIEVYNNKKAFANLNELEFIDGKIYANVWQQNFILEIDPQTGKVLAQINCDEVIAKAKGTGEVLNGIAYNPITKKLYFTGKNWSNIAEVTIN
jgi:glutamine cyclotransferase